VEFRDGHRIIDSNDRKQFGASLDLVEHNQAAQPVRRKAWFVKACEVGWVFEVK